MKISRYVTVLGASRGIFMFDMKMEMELLRLQNILKRMAERIRKLFNPTESDLRSFKALRVKPIGLLMLSLLFEKFLDAIIL